VVESVPEGGVTTLEHSVDDLLQKYRARMHDIPEEIWEKVLQDLRERKPVSATLSAVPLPQADG
jgi:hypothetical protein